VFASAGGSYLQPLLRFLRGARLRHFLPRRLSVGIHASSSSRGLETARNALLLSPLIAARTHFQERFGFDSENAFGARKLTPIFPFAPRARKASFCATGGTGGRRRFAVRTSGEGCGSSKCHSKKRSASICRTISSNAWRRRETPEGHCSQKTVSKEMVRLASRVQKGQEILKAQIYSPPAHHGLVVVVVVVVWTPSSLSRSQGRAPIDREPFFPFFEGGNPLLSSSPAHYWL